jgi:hypothetical protein
MTYSFMAGNAASKKPIRKRLDAAALDVNAAARLLEEPPNAGRPRQERR